MTWPLILGAVYLVGVVGLAVYESSRHNPDDTPLWMPVVCIALWPLTLLFLGVVMLGFRLFARRVP